MHDPLPRKLAVIFYADVAGYSRLTGVDEDATHRTLAEYLDFIANTIETRQGQVTHYAGDAVLARFDAVVDAVSAALDIQKFLYERNHGLGDERKLQFRIGVNLGDVIHDRGDIYGDGVNIAARLESLAEPGGICISESVRTAIGGKLELAFEDLGKQRVKNIAEPVQAYRIKGFGAGNPDSPGGRSTTAGVTEKPSIVVMQFQNISNDAAQDYFAEGIAEEIMTRLNRYREMVVIHIGSARVASKQNADVVDITRQLGVQYALTGSVRKAGDRVRITTSLIEGSSGQQIWSEQYDHVLVDIFEVQDEVAQKIVAMLVGKIERSHHERSLGKSVNDLSAYEYVLHGRYCIPDWQGSKEDVLKARQLFLRAIEIEPRYAAGYSGLAATYIMEIDDGWALDADEAGTRALEYAHKAIELDEHDSYAHLMLSYAYWHVKSDFELARHQLETAIALNPNYYWNFCYGCWFSTCYGDLETSIRQAKEAILRNPLLPNSCLHSQGIAEYLSGHYEDAINTLCRISRLEPRGYACLAACHAQLGRIDEARKIARECIEHKGECAMTTEDWRKFWIAELKFKNDAPIDRFIEGLDKAGLVKK